MDQYLGYIGGPAGALALTGVAAASAFYLASRPTAEKPLVDLNHQASVLPVIKYFILKKNHYYYYYYYHNGGKGGENERKGNHRSPLSPHRRLSLGRHFVDDKKKIFFFFAK